MLFLYIAYNFINLGPLGHTIFASVAAGPKTTCDAVGGVLGQIVGFVDDVKGVVETIGFAVFFIGVTIAAIMRMIAFGSDRRIMVSNMAITSAIVGMAIVAMSVGIQTYLINQFGGGCH